jgi:hypothetical protein
MILVFYHEITMILAIGNPIKGLCPSPEYISFPDWTPLLPASLGEHKWPLHAFLLNDVDLVGEEAAFNWTFIENKLQQVADRGIRAVFRFYIHWPGQPLNIPPYLLHPSYNITFLNNYTEIYYDSPTLKKAIKQCIDALGRRYDGDKRIFAIQAGFLGYWGEWHTSGCEYIGINCLPSWVSEEVIQ